ncbi:MAG: cell wall hydrolase [Lachnospiraceae bacterium]|nr:cell wall hydrolase [Lachnospiraceae bacterium]
MWKRKKHKIALFMTIVLLAGCVPTISYATSTQDKLDQAEKDKDKLEQQQQDSNDKLDNLENTQKNLKSELNKLNEQLTQVSEHLADLEDQIAVKEKEIADIIRDLADARDLESWQYQCMKKRIQLMYEQNDKSVLNALLEMGGFADFLNFNENFEQLTAYDQMMFDEYVANREYIESEELRLNQEKVALDGLKMEAEAEKSKVSGLIGQTTNSIANYEEQIEDVEAQIRAYEAQIKEKEKDIKALKKKIEEEKALAAAAANAAWRDISEVTFAEGDRYLLANLIYCEAGGEPYEGQVAVGAVVINRLLSSKFPNTITGVIYQKNQFSPVKSGRYALALSQNRATEKCYRAADEAMAGVTNVGNCLFFRTPIEGLTGIRIGGHIFY